MYGVPGTTSSRVPATRPARPMAGFFFRRSTVCKILSTTRPAAAGSSTAMYSASASRLASALRSHLTRTANPLLRHPLYFPLACKVSSVRLRQPFVNLFNLPAIQLHVVPDRFRPQDHPGPPRTRPSFVALPPPPSTKPHRQDPPPPLPRLLPHPT